MWVDIWFLLKFYHYWPEIFLVNGLSYSDSLLPWEALTEGHLKQGIIVEKMENGQGFFADGDKTI